MKKTILLSILAFASLCIFVSSASDDDSKLYLALDTGNMVFVDRDNKDLLNCLCKCYEVGQFSCRYDTESKGTSPSCRDLKNGDCICQAFGCFRKPLPTNGDCYQKCQTKYSGNRTGGSSTIENIRRVPTLTLHTNNSNKFTHCQDLAYAEIYSRTPPTMNVSKGLIKSGLRKYNYTLQYNFEVTTNLVGKVRPHFQEGDILIFAPYGPPNEANAPHYAVYTNRYIYDITFFSTIGKGKLNRRTDINYYFRKRLITRPDGSQTYSPIVYKYCKIYRRQ